VDDLVDGMIKMMNQDEFSGPVNLGRPEEYTILEIAEKVLSMIETKSKIVFKPLPSDDPTKRRPNIALAKDKLNWEPTTSFDDGLSKTIEYFKNKTNE
jgi:UDP-glucuronate decarboxylase